MRIERLIEQWREMGPVRWAEHRMGWLMEDGKPIVLEPWQRAALDAWWEHRETTRTLALSNCKKSGKTTCNAVLAAWRWLALPGEHFCCANDLDQAQGRQYQMIDEMCKRHPLLAGQVHSTRDRLTFGATGSTLTALAVDAAGTAGANHWTVSHTEAWGIIYEGGIRAWEELTPPPGQRDGFPALRIADSYAGWLGESETWHDLVDRGLAGERLPGDWPIYRLGGLLLFHMEGEEAQVACYRGTDLEREAYYADERASYRASAYTRMHLNRRTSGESQFVAIELFDALEDRACRPVTPGDKRPLWLAVDAGTKRDAAALVGCTWNDKAGRAELALVREWHPSVLAYLTAGLDLDETVGAEIMRLRKECSVREVRYDAWQMAAISTRLEKAGIRVVEMPQTAQRTEADQLLYDAITAGTLGTFHSPELRAAMTKAAGQETPRGYRLLKRSGDDLVVALSMAHYGAMMAHKGMQRIHSYSYIDDPPEPKPTTAGEIAALMNRRYQEAEAAAQRPHRW